MKVISCPIEGLLIIDPLVFKDSRGLFFESFRQDFWENILPGIHFVQDNHSVSHKNVLRGLHFQHPPYEQGKLVRVVRGSALDVAVDIRKKSPTYGKYYSVILSDRNNTLFYIPPGFAHGFLALEDNTVFLYKCTQYYHPSSEDTLLWNDPDLNIAWNMKEPLVSDKDKKGKFFRNFISPF